LDPVTTSSSHCGIWAEWGEDAGRDSNQMGDCGNPMRAGAQHKESRAQNPEELTRAPGNRDKENSGCLQGTMPVFLFIPEAARDRFISHHCC